MSDKLYIQQWTPLKIMSYVIYKLFLQKIPADTKFFNTVSNMIKCRICRPLFFEAAERFKIGRGVDFDNGSNIILREHANIGDYCLIDGKRGLVTIGRHVMMGKYVVIICQNHKFLKNGGYNGFTGKDVLIDDYAWIGHRVIILPGVHIGKHAIIGAGSVVTKDIPDFSVAAGNPAVIKKKR